MEKTKGHPSPTKLMPSWYHRLDCSEFPSKVSILNSRLGKSSRMPWAATFSRKHGLEYFGPQPLILFVDEAHNFLGRNLGGEESTLKLDSFELIAKEGRKYGLNICLSTQRPRDVTEGVLSQMGTLIVHRLTNDRDREVVERACGEIDRSASAFLPNLEPGEAAIVGVDFPIPLTIQINLPSTPPQSRGANYQRHWKNPPPAS